MRLSTLSSPHMPNETQNEGGAVQSFGFDRNKAAKSIEDPDGALWPVNAYSDADELDSLIQAALDSAVIAQPNRRAHLYIYPLSLSEPDPVLVYDPGHGRALLGHALKLSTARARIRSSSPCACSRTSPRKPTSCLTTTQAPAAPPSMRKGRR